MNSSDTQLSNAPEEKILSVKVRDLHQLKLVLATWYSYLREKSATLDEEQFRNALRTPVVYDIEKDEIELLIPGSEGLLSDLNVFLRSISGS
ncbi:MAG: hypothetical protein F9K24_03825 [Leptonema illini]|jgi:hypothetical protein|uniref:Uncharacterized protein n=1 Tax=Leptonema illini TaxID=183 RepID=A0A833H574_9LEPT|nr:MAG: hypothetical protein F9K24_03825 [Leptonema illini]